MSCVKLLNYVYAVKDHFHFEDYSPEGQLFVIVEDGSFAHSTQGYHTQITPLQGLYYHEGRQYHRKANGMMKLHIFRFESKDNIFDKDIINFTDLDRIKSDIKLLCKFDDIESEAESFDYKSHIFNDIVWLYEFENRNKRLISEFSDMLIAEVVRKINMEINASISVAELAADSHISYIQFLRRFKAATGLAPNKYIARVKIKKAQYLLINTELCVNEISALCGFDSEYYFSLFFKKNTGLSPLKYRNELSSYIG